MTKHAAELEARIAAAFTDGAKSEDIGRLLPEVEAAANAADAVAKEARTRALDPLLPSDGVTLARREMDDASFKLSVKIRCIDWSKDKSRPLTALRLYLLPWRVAEKFAKLLQPYAWSATSHPSTMS
jgi:hypothetical protein